MTGDDVWQAESARQLRQMRWMIVGVNIAVIIVFAAKGFYWMIPLNVGVIAYMMVLPKWVRVLNAYANPEPEPDADPEPVNKMAPVRDALLRQMAKFSDIPEPEQLATQIIEEDDTLRLLVEKYGVERIVAGIDSGEVLKVSEHPPPWLANPN